SPLSLVATAPAPPARPSFPTRRLFRSFPDREIEGLSRETVLERLRPLLEDPRYPKVGQNVKYDLIVLERAGVKVSGIVLDTMVRSEEHTSELQSREKVVCRLLLAKTNR